MPGVSKWLVYKHKYFSKLKFWKLLSISEATFNLQNVNLLRNPNVNPQNGVGYKINNMYNINMKMFCFFK